MLSVLVTVIVLHTLYSGAAISMVISLYSLPILLILYIWARKLHKQTWDGE